jgi:hypothetical protein
VYSTKRRRFFPDFEEFENVVDDLREKNNRLRQNFKTRRQLDTSTTQKHQSSINRATDLNDDETEMTNYHLLES